MAYKSVGSPKIANDGDVRDLDKDIKMQVSVRMSYTHQ
jgi:hypothetical protein